MSADAPQARGVLATPQQFQTESRAIEILFSEAMKRQIAESRERMEVAPAAATEEGRRTLESALQELAGWAALMAANSDPEHPSFFWTIASPRRWHGHRVPGSRWIADNADNVYRYSVINDSSHYVVRARPTGPKGSFSIMVYDYFTGEEGKKMEGAQGGLLDKDMRFEPDASVIITVGPEPANGRGNHLQTKRGACVLWSREALSDWESERPLDLTIERVGPTPPRPSPSTQDLIPKAVSLLFNATTTMLRFEDRYSPLPVNDFAKVVSRSANLGIIKLGSFKIADDEALVIVADALDPDYWGASVLTPWLITVEHVHASGTLNKGQAERGSDGTYTLVISARDPGVKNWLDTNGLHQGGMAVRWQSLNSPVADPNAAIRSVRRVKLAQLRDVLPTDTNGVTPSERRLILAARAKSYMHRCGDACEVYSGVGAE